MHTTTAVRLKEMVDDAGLRYAASGDEDPARRAHR